MTKTPTTGSPSADTPTTGSSSTDTPTSGSPSTDAPGTRPPPTETPRPSVPRTHAVPAILAAAAMIVALVFRHELVAWFTGATIGGQAAGSGQSGATPPPGGAAAPGAAAAPAGASGSDTGAIAYYTCSMHPQVHLDRPGTCPICSMPLVPVGRQDQVEGLIRVDEGRRAVLGIRTTRAIRAAMQLDIRAEGRLVVDETRLHDVTLKIGGYVGQLAVNATGQRVARGQVLLTLYSPELYAAQQEYLIALQARDLVVPRGTLHGSPAAASPPAAGSAPGAHSGGDAARGDAARGDALVRSAETKLRLWGFADDQLRAIVESNQPIERVPFRSPAAGVVIEKAVVEGAAVTAGQRLFRIADLDQIWVEADVHEADLARIASGDRADVALTYLPGRTFEGKVAFVYPYLDPTSRTGRVRIALANKQLELKPDMFAAVTFHLALGDRIQVPSTAVIYTGPRRLVFVDLGGGRLRPQEVTIGARSGERVEIIDGLHAGDLVVSSGNFLIAAESRIRSTTTLWGDRHDGR